MSLLAKKVIEKLSAEQDAIHFYEYFKETTIKSKWLDVKKDDPSDEELKICNEYKNSKEEVVPLQNLIKNLTSAK